jgi:hypothetical protein
MNETNDISQTGSDMTPSRKSKPTNYTFTPPPKKSNRQTLTDIPSVNPFHTGSGKILSKFMASKEDQTLSAKMPNFQKAYDFLVDIIETRDGRLSLGITDTISLSQKDTSDSFFISEGKSKSSFFPSPDSKFYFTSVNALITKQERKKLTIEEEKIVQNLTNTEEIKDFYEYTEDCLKRIAMMKIPIDQEIEHLKLTLPIDLGGKKLAIFDLDETLVHCEIKNPKNGDVLIEVKLPSGEKAQVYNRLI